MSMLRIHFPHHCVITGLTAWEKSNAPLIEVQKNLIYLYTMKSFNCPFAHINPLLKGQDIFLQAFWQSLPSPKNQEANIPFQDKQQGSSVDPNFSTTFYRL